MTAVAKFLDDYRFLKKNAEFVIKACTVTEETMYDGVKKVESVLIPAGGGKYPAKYPSMWVRDVAMNSVCGVVSPELMRRHVEIIAKCGQNGDRALGLKNNLVVPPWALADHVNYNGRPVYFPGTYLDGDDQGDGSFGFFPPHDDNYYFVDFVCTYIDLTGDAAILDETFSGVTLLERIEKAWAGFSIDAQTDLCSSSMPYYTVDWGFCDMIRKSGLLLFPSLLRSASARCLAHLLSKLGQSEKAAAYRNRAATIAAQVENAFVAETHDRLYSSTGIGRQFDVWGTLYAIYTGVLSQAVEERCVKTIADAYLDGDAIALSGYVRQISTRDDTNGTSWESVSPCHLRHNTYQNGGYWASVSGWLFYSLAKYDLNLAFKAVGDYVAHTRKYAEQCAPFEWINPTLSETEFEGHYGGTCATIPYEGAKRMVKEFKLLGAAS